jgi:hypothetical protein
MDRAMAASLDRWLTTPPGEYDPEYMTPPHCGECGGFLKMEPERVEPGEDVEQCQGEPEPEGYYGAECGSWTQHAPHSFTVNAWVTEYRTCTRCGHVNTSVEA